MGDAVVQHLKPPGAGSLERFGVRSCASTPEADAPDGPAAKAARLHALDALVSQDGGEIVPMLQTIQRTLGFLPADVLELVAQRTGVPLAQLYGVATFYTSFVLEPRGRHVVRVCHGTACHVRGAPRLTEALSAYLDVEPGHTTSDGEHTLESVACLGCCSLAPAITIGDDTHGRLDARRAVEVVEAHTARARRMTGR